MECATSRIDQEKDRIFEFEDNVEELGQIRTKIQ